MKSFFCLLLAGCFSASTWAEVHFVDVAPALGSAWAEGRFNQTKSIAGLPLPLHSSGTFSLQGEELIWLTQEPMVSELHFSAQGISQWKKGEKSWEMTAQQQPVIATISQLMMAMVAGQWEKLDQAFRVESFEQGKEACWSLKIISKDSVLSRVVQRLDVSGCERVNAITLHEKSGNVTALNFLATKQGEH